MTPEGARAASADPAGAAASAPPRSEPPPSAPPSTWQLLQQLLRDLPRLFGDRVDLLALELHRAALALTQVVVLLIAAAILGITAWLAAWGLVAYALVSAGLATWLAWLIVLLLNGAAAAFAFIAARKLLIRLTLPATRRHLRHPLAAFSAAPPAWPVAPAPPDRAAAAMAGARDPVPGT